MRFFIIALLCLLACAGVEQTPATAPAPPTLTVTYTRPASPVAHRVRYTSLDERGQPVQPAVTFDPAGTHQVPAGGVTLRIEVVDLQGNAIADFQTQSESITDPGFVSTSDPTVSSFVTFGCNRVNPKDIDPSVPSTANLAQLQADFTEIQALAPAYLFFTGDLVDGDLVKDLPASRLPAQLAAWKAMFLGSGLTVPLVAITGNHEVLAKNAQDVEVPAPANPAVWIATMQEFIRGNNGPTPVAPNLDQLFQSEAQLSYTFRDGDTAYVVLNTDTFVVDGNGNLTETTGDIPLVWLADQLAQLQADPTVSHIFLFGHRPVDSPDTGNPGIREPEAGAFVAMLGSTPKVRAYLCAHAHLWDTFKVGSVTQVIAGNGGSDAFHAFKKKGYYGYTVVKRKQSGDFHVESYGRPIPSPYHSKEAQPAATLREKFTLSGS